jgi:hypothetical protein
MIYNLGHKEYRIREVIICNINLITTTDKQVSYTPLGLVREVAVDKV